MPANENIERALGIVIGQLQDIKERLHEQDESRELLKKQLDDLVMRTTFLENDLSGVNRKMSGVENFTDDLKALKYQAKGAGTLGQWLIKAGVAIVAFVGWALSIYTWLTGRPPP